MRRSLSHFVVLAILLSACAPRQAVSALPPWLYTDLRTLDPVDGPLPTHDLVALYLRRLGGDLQFRLDLLEVASEPDYDLHLTLSTGEGDIAITIPASGGVRAYANDQPLSNLKPRVVRDPLLDTIVISLNRDALPGIGLGFEMHITLTPAGSTIVEDEVEAVRSDAAPPPQADVLLAFWNLVQSTTPAQAIRQWDGAHSGPGRARHGLRYLLNAVKTAYTPVFLLDLKTPTALSAIDYLNAMPQIQRLVIQGLVVLPDTAPRISSTNSLPSWAFDRILAQYRQTSLDFGLPTSQLLYSLVVPETVPARYSILITPNASSSRIPTAFLTRMQGQTVLAVPETMERELQTAATSDGPALALKQALLQVALDPTRPVLLMGGDFPNTTWGNPESVGITLQYLASRPWIHFLTVDELLNRKPATTEIQSSPTPAFTLAPIQNQVLEALRQSPPGPVTDAAWQAYLSLVTPTSPELAELRLNYFGQIGHLIAASDWAASPYTRSDCITDIDWDGEAECILASELFFFTFEKAGGYINTAFFLSGQDIHQVIAPSYQFTLGLSDPSVWNTARGLAGDPSVVPGAFFDNQTGWISLEAQPSPGKIVFTNPEGTIRKTYTPTPDGIRLFCQTPGPAVLQVGLGLDPWERFSPGWADGYREEITPDGERWLLEPGLEIELRTSGELASRSFVAPRPYLFSSEDPDFDYPQGFFLPFPLTVIEVFSQGTISIELLVR